MEKITLIKRIIGWILILLCLPTICGIVFKYTGDKFFDGFLVGLTITGIFLVAYGFVKLLCWLFDYEC